MEKPDMEKLSPDSPELVAIANLAGIEPSRAAAAFNDPEHMGDHFTFNELGRLHRAFERLGATLSVIAEGVFKAMAIVKRGMN